MYVFVLLFIVCFEHDQNVLRGGTVSPAAKHAHDIVETALYVITWLDNVRKGVIQGGQGLSVKKVNELIKYEVESHKVRDKWGWISSKRKQDREKENCCLFSIHSFLNEGKGKYLLSLFFIHSLYRLENRKKPLEDTFFSERCPTFMIIVFLWYHFF